VMEQTAQVNEKFIYSFLIIVIEVLCNSTNFSLQLFHLVVRHLVVQTLFARKTLEPLCVCVMLVTKVMDTTAQVCVRCQAAFCNVTTVLQCNGLEFIYKSKILFPLL